jgi:ubiquinone biosynthesis protein UbiJ
MERKKGLAGELVELGVKLAIDASEKLLGDPRGQGAITAVSELAQKAVSKLEALQGSAARAVGSASREDLKALEEQVARLQRQAGELAAKLEAMAREKRTTRPGRGWRDPEDMEPR